MNEKAVQGEFSPEAQRILRQREVNFARASVGLEGFKPTAEAEASARLYVQGRISLAEFATTPLDAEKTLSTGNALSLEERQPLESDTAFSQVSPKKMK